LRTGSADTVVALDVLEHTDDIHHAFTELCRVASRYVVITLPNMYDWKTRIRYLRGRQLGAKYGLPVDPPGDRHRWFFGLDEARAFCRANGSRAGWRIIDERVLVGPAKSVRARTATRDPAAALVLLDLSRRSRACVIGGPEPTRGGRIQSEIPPG
jgi:hypothetical protein